VEAVDVPMGDDHCAIVTGGDRPHVGAVALAQARPSLRDSSTVSATTSVVTSMGHKEDSLARGAAQRLASALNCNVVVCCGIHLEVVSPPEMEFIDQAVAEHETDDRLGELAIQEVRQSGASAGGPRPASASRHNSID
jgi:hypothetical protein